MCSQIYDSRGSLNFSLDFVHNDLDGAMNVGYEIADVEC